MSVNKPLDGIHVVDLSQYVSGPAATSMLADWGAQVIKVEAATGDPQRTIGPTIGMPGTEDCNPFYGLYNQNKLTTVLNLKDHAGREAMERLLAWADVFVTNWRPKALAKMGLDYESMHSRFPRIIWGSINGFGNYGPEKDDPGYDTVAFWAKTGLMLDMCEGGEDGSLASPLIPFYGVGDTAASTSLAGGIGAALYKREKTGEGSQVFVSLLAQGIWNASCSVASSQYDNHYPKTRTRPASPVASSYKTKDNEWIFTTIFDVKAYPRYLEAVGRADLKDDPRFNNPVGATEHREELFHIIEEGFAKFTFEEMMDRLTKYDIPHSQVCHVASVHTNPQALANHNVFEYINRDGSKTMMVSSPVTFSDNYEPEVRIPYGRLGEHTVEVLRMLGYSEEEIKKMLAEGSAMQHA